MPPRLTAEKCGGEVTRILREVHDDGTSASEELLPLVYGELRRLAAQKLSQERPGQTLQPTALVHEAYIRLMGAEGQQWETRGHFFAAAAEGMRRILIENARRKKRAKRGGDLKRVDLVDVDLGVADGTADLLVLNDALDKLRTEDPAAADLVKLRYFAGLSVEQAGSALQLSRANAYRHWAFARAWLQCEMKSSKS